MDITVIGTGYVGLVTGTCLAESGNNVLCVDIDKEKIVKMQNGIIPIYEPGLEVLFERNIRQNMLSFTTDLKEGIKNAEIIFLALPTPPGEDGSADLQYVLKVSEDLGSLLKKYTIIVNKSTVPIGTSKKVRDKISLNCKVDFDVVSNPEFLKEGFAVEDFMKPDRIVIGTKSKRAKEMMEKLYKPFVRQGNPIIFMDEASAEMTKYAANSFLATKITFMNEIANLCDKVGANVDDVRRGIGTDPRIGKSFIFPGIGYGGSCFPKDVQALHKIATENKYDFRILTSVMQVNTVQKVILLPKILEYFKGNIKGKTIALWGLSFKPNTDDIREAPSIYLIEALLKEGALVRAFDPEAMCNFKKLMGDRISYGKDQYEILKNADALVIVTEWQAFRTPDFKIISSLMNNNAIFDGRNLFDVAELREMGYHYISIGRNNIY